MKTRLFLVVCACLTCFVGFAQSGPPVITQDLTNITVVAGQTATFSVGASGTAPLSYQWQFISGGVTNNLTDGLTGSGATISGSATPTLTISSVTAANAGDYQVEVANAFGTVTSSVAQLNVFLGPSIYLYTGTNTITVTLQPGCYDITAYGAQGGIDYLGTNGFNAYDPSRSGGLGAEMEGQFHFSAVTTLTLLVGGAGADANADRGGGGGGGGGSFVVNGGTPLVVAGGGGGAGLYLDGGYTGAGGNGLIGTSGGSGGYVSGASEVGYGSGGASGGTGGTGGTGGHYIDNYGWQVDGGGGGGFDLGTNGNGTAGLDVLRPAFGPTETGGDGGISFLNGGEGGSGGIVGGSAPNSGPQADGGYGGGGGAGDDGGGGGGGYSGGGGGADGENGGGGGSYIGSSASATLYATLTKISGAASPDDSPNGEIIITEVTNGCPPCLEFDCPSNILTLTSSCTNVPVYFPQLTVTDRCCTNWNVEYSPPSGSSFPPNMVTPVTCTIWDTCGNTDSCTFTVTVLPGTNLPVQSPTNILVFSCASNNVAVFYPDLTVGNLCCTNRVVFNPPSGSSFAPGTASAVAWSVYDCSSSNLLSSGTFWVSVFCSNCCNCTNYTNYTVTVFPGSNYLGDWLCQGTNNTLADVLPSVPQGTEVYFWNQTLQQFITPPDTFSSGQWGIGTEPLFPGEGFLLVSPAKTNLTIYGCIPGCFKGCTTLACATTLFFGGTGLSPAPFDTEVCGSPPVGTDVLEPPVDSNGNVTGAGLSTYVYTGSWPLNTPPDLPVGYAEFVVTPPCPTTNAFPMWDGGSGSWSNATNWLNNLVPNGSGIIVDFSELILWTNFTVMLDIPVTVGGLIFGDQGYFYNWTLANGGAGPLTLNNGTNASFIKVENETATITAVIAGTNGMSKFGWGTLTLAGANTYSGPTTVSAGLLDINATGSVLGNVTIINTGTLELDHASALSSAATLTLPSSPPSGVVNLNFSGTQDISHLNFGSTGEATGTWGAPGSSAVNVSSAFTGAGILNVTGMAPPTITSQFTTSITATGASLNASVNPNGAQTECWFNWGTTTNWNISLPPQNLGNGTTNVAVVAPLSSLSPGTTYHYQLEATNSAGTTLGPDQVFTTLPLSYSVPIVTGDNLLGNPFNAASAGSVILNLAPLNDNFDTPGDINSFFVLTWNGSSFHSTYYENDFTADNGFGSTNGWATDDSGSVQATPPILYPGCAFFVNNTGPGTNIVFGDLPYTIGPQGCFSCGTISYLSLAGTNAGTFQNLTGVAPEQGDELLTWNGSGFTTNTFVSGVWTGGTPVVNPAQGYGVYIPCTTNPPSYSLVLPPGDTLIGNPLDNSNNEANVVFPNPDPAQDYSGPYDTDALLVYTCGAGFRTVFFDSVTTDTTTGFFDESGNPTPAPILAPGCAFFFVNETGASQTNVFTGTVPTPVFPPACYCGTGVLSYFSLQGTNTGTFQSLTGFEPANGDELLTYNGGVSTTNTFLNGAWTGGTPVLNPGVGYGVQPIEDQYDYIQCPTNIVLTSCTDVQVNYLDYGLTYGSPCCNNHVALSCTPPNGSFFAPGTVTKVCCTVTDDCISFGYGCGGAPASCCFTVTVLKGTDCSCVPPPTNMVLWLPFDELSGSSAANLSDLFYPGTEVDTTHVPNQYVDNSLYFNGSAHVSVPDYPAIEIGTGNLTIDAWVLLETNADILVPSVIVDKRNGSGDGYSLSVYNDYLILTLNNQNSDNSTFRKVPADGQWHFVAVALNQNSSPPNLLFYVDGMVALATPEPKTTFNLDNTSDLWVGASGSLGGNQPWLGDLDEVEVYDRALGTNELAAIYDAGPLGKCKPPCTNLTVICPTNKTVQCNSAWSLDGPQATTCCTNLIVGADGVATNVLVTSLGISTNGSCPQRITQSWLITDGCGHSNMCSQTVTVDCIAVQCPTNKTVECCSAWSFDAPTATTCCTNLIVGTNGIATNVLVTSLGLVTNGACPRYITQSWLITDACGQSNTCSQTVTVVNTNPPMVNCPTGAVVVPLNANCELVIPGISVTASSCCYPPCQLTYTQSPTAGSTLAVGITSALVTVCVTDPCGNSNCCTALVVGEPKNPPVVTCPASMTVTNCTVPCVPVSASSCFCPPNFLSITQSPACGTLIAPGIDSVTVTVTDCHGNSSYKTVHLNISGLGSFLDQMTNTGVGPNGFLADGAEDPAWALNILPINICSNMPPDYHGYPVVVSRACYPAFSPCSGVACWTGTSWEFNYVPWTLSSPVSKWIAPNFTDNGCDPCGLYYYSYQFTLPGGICPASTVISGRWAADNGGVQIYVNGNPTGNSTTSLLYGFTTWTPFVLSSGFQAGVNTLLFVVTNGPAETSFTGLQVEFTNAYGCCYTCAPPVIHSITPAQSLPEGSTATFSVTAAGTPPFTYQWYFGSTKLAGATGPTVRVTAPNVLVGGLYSVVISNACGVVTGRVPFEVTPGIVWPVGFWNVQVPGSPLSATLGPDLNLVGPDESTNYTLTTGTTEDFGLPELGGQIVNVMHVSPSRSTSLQLPLLAPSGSSTVSSYTVMMDIYEPDTSLGTPSTLFATAGCCISNLTSGGQDGLALTLDTNNNLHVIGSVGGAPFDAATSTTLPVDAWNRVALVVNAPTTGSATINLYNNSQTISFVQPCWCSAPTPCGCCPPPIYTYGTSINWANTSPTVLSATADALNPNAEFYVSSLQFQAAALTPQTIAGFGSPVNGPAPVVNSTTIGASPELSTTSVNGTVNFSWSGSSYQLQETTNLTSGVWVDSQLPFTEAIGSTGNVMTTAVVAPSSGAPVKFYRLVFRP